MRVIYASKKGGKPMVLGMNRAKRVAHDADRRDQLIVQRELGAGLPRQHSHHQLLVKQRHQYYGDVYEQSRSAAPQSASFAGVGTDVGAVPAAEAGPDLG